MSLKFLMSNCQDFEEEESLLQSMGHAMGVLVNRTPTCHCEVAGEAIEYSQGRSKNEYQQMQILNKRGIENVRTAVRKCLSREIPKNFEMGKGIHLCTP